MVVVSCCVVLSVVLSEAVEVVCAVVLLTVVVVVGDVCLMLHLNDEDVVLLSLCAPEESSGLSVPVIECSFRCPS